MARVVAVRELRVEPERVLRVLRVLRRLRVEGVRPEPVRVEGLGVVVAAVVAAAPPTARSAIPHALQ
jgi:hypothetical protein